MNVRFQYALSSLATASMLSLNPYVLYPSHDFAGPAGPGPAEVKKSFMVGEPRTWEPSEVWFLKKLTFLQEACKPSKATKQGMRSGGLCRQYAGYWCFLIAEGLEKYWMLEGWFNVRLHVPKRVWNWQLMVGLSEKEGILTKTWNLVEQSTGRCQAQPSSSSNSGTGQGYRNHGESGS